MTASEVVTIAFNNIVTTYFNSISQERLQRNERGRFIANIMTIFTLGSSWGTLEFLRVVCFLVGRGGKQILGSFGRVLGLLEAPEEALVMLASDFDSSVNSLIRCFLYFSVP